MPLPSRKTRCLPAGRAFFYMRPARGPPALDSRLVPLPGAAVGLLATPPLAAENPPDVGGVIADPEGLRDERGHTGQGPEVGRVPVGGGPLAQESQEALPQPDGQSGWAPRGRLGLEGLQPTRLHLGLPPTDRGR